MLNTIFKISLLSTATLLTLGLSEQQAQAAFFQGLGDLPGGGFSSFASGVSGDGSIVVGSGRSSNGLEAFRWTQSGGMVSLGDLPGGDFYSGAFGVSEDGSVVVGSSTSNNRESDYENGHEAFRWTQSGGMVGLGYLPGGDFNSEGRGVSGDGSVVVGGSYRYDTYEAFRWTQSGGMVGLGELPGGNFYSFATGVSGDGSVVVGESYSDGAYGYEAFRWTQSGGMVGLGYLSSGEYYFLSYSSASGVSGDGSVVVGSSTSNNGDEALFGDFAVEAFRWTQSGGMVGLGDLPGGDFSSNAYGVSGDGSVVVGSSYSDNGNESFIWNSTEGMRSLKNVLTNEYGLNLDGWYLNSANAISPDGLTIVGSGRNPNGQGEAWIARLEPVPEPLTILGSATALGFGAFFKRQQAKKLQKKKNAN